MAFFGFYTPGIPAASILTSICSAADLTPAVQRQATLTVTKGARPGGYYANTRRRILPYQGAPVSATVIPQKGSLA